MKRTLISTLIAALFALPSVASAQEPTTAMADSTESDSAATEELPSAEEDDADAEDGDDILQVIALPMATDELRESGVEEEEIQEALEGAEEVGLSAGETSEVLLEEQGGSRYAFLSSDGRLLALADQTDGNINFNGDDALVLTYAGSQPVDSFGVVGVDPGSYLVLDRATRSTLAGSVTWFDISRSSIPASTMTSASESFWQQIPQAPP